MTRKAKKYLWDILNSITKIEFYIKDLDSEA